MRSFTDVVMTCALGTRRRSSRSALPNSPRAWRSFNISSAPLPLRVIMTMQIANMMMKPGPRNIYGAGQ
jgi:hypothetical protein